MTFIGLHISPKVAQKCQSGNAAGLAASQPRWRATSSSLRWHREEENKLLFCTLRRGASSRPRVFARGIILILPSKAATERECFSTHTALRIVLYTVGFTAHTTYGWCAIMVYTTCNLQHQLTPPFRRSSGKVSFIFLPPNHQLLHYLVFTLKGTVVQYCAQLLVVIIHTPKY